MLGRIASHVHSSSYPCTQIFGACAPHIVHRLWCGSRRRIVAQSLVRTGITDSPDQHCAHTQHMIIYAYSIWPSAAAWCVCALSVAAADDVLQIVRKYVLNYQCFIHSDPSNATHLSTAKECPAGRCTITATARWRNCIFIYLSFIAVTEQHAAVHKKMERNTPTQRARRVRVQRVTTQTYIEDNVEPCFYVLFDKKKPTRAL